MEKEEAKMFKGIRRLFKSKDEKPVLLTFLLQRDECSRLLGEFYEKHLDNCQKLVIVWLDQEDDLKIVSSDNLPENETAGILLKASFIIGSGGDGA